MKKNIKNFSFVFAEKIIRLVVLSAVFILIARELGPDDFGIYSYIISFVSIFSSISLLGMNGILIREWGYRSKEANKIISASLLLYLVASIFSGVAFVLLIYFGIVKYSTFFTYILSFKFILDIGLIFRYFLEHRLMMRSVIMIDIGVLLSFSLVKIILIFLELITIDKLIILMIFESLIASVFFIFVGNKYLYEKFNFDFEIKEFIFLFKQSYPLLIASMAWVLYTRVDQLMIGWMRSSEEVGYYSIAMRFVDISIFFTAAMVTVFFPVILKKRLDSREEYIKIFDCLYQINSLYFYVFILFLFFFGKELLNLIFSGKYDNSFDILIVLCGVGLFNGMALISGRFYIAENMQKVTMYRHLIGLLLNVVMNFYLIHDYGAIGAAYSSLFSMAMANLFFDAFFKSTRIVFFQKMKSLFMLSFFNLIRN